jgi:1-acyl-sn-glycerol-3-phosphate acyltransferase
VIDDHASPHAPLGKRLFYHSVQALCRGLLVLIYDLRCLHRERCHFTGPALILSTHQSHFDPVLVGVTFNERLSFLARRTLFKNRLFALLIRLLEAIELDRDRSGLAGLKETLKKLKQGKKVLIFPEGTRTSDGNIGPLKPGFLAVARRSRVPLIPIVVHGAYQVLPRSSLCPRYFPLRVAVGEVIQPHDYLPLSDAEILDLISARFQQCSSELAAVP